MKMLQLQLNNVLSEKHSNFGVQNLTKIINTFTHNRKTIPGFVSQLTTNYVNIKINCPSFYSDHQTDSQRPENQMRS